ncbi:hypothetical protein EDD86DRAFT_200409 [Gorgonomyces haynaldii]|nr:hypothetical protein EDD86DRAFT_200409 [Gorgonomyces haynaldii]
MPIVVALFDYDGITEKELSFKKGAKFELVNSDNADWWFVDDGQSEGYAPASYLKLGDDVSEDSSLEEYSEESFVSEEEEEEAEEVEEEQEDEIDLDLDIKGVLNNLKRRKSRMKPVEGVKLLSPDPIEGLSDLHPAYRKSTLAKNDDCGIGKLENSLLPELSASGLAFRDLFLDKNKIRKRSTPCTIAFSVLEARSMALPQGLTILGRHVRMALFDKTNIRSNIHHIPAIATPENQSVWRFSTKASLLFPKDDENTVFLRAKDVDIKLSLLFEMCLTVEHPEKQEPFELSCGWAMFPLFTLDGSPIENKTYELKLHGGTPFEKGIALPEPFEPKRLSFMSSQKFPRLNIRLWKLSSQALGKLNELPETLIANLSCSNVLSVYRQIQAHSLLGHAKDAGVGPKYEPVLSIMPRILEESDLMHLFVGLWDKKYKKLKKSEKQFQRLRRHFTLTVQTMWPLLEIYELPQYVPGNQDRLLQRSKLWSSMQELGTLVFLGKPQGLQFKPFHTDEVEYDYLKRQAAL